MLNPKKIDVTDRVVGKIKDGEIELLLENSIIGRIKMPENLQYELEHHYEADQQKIYQNVTVSEGKDARYTDCGDGGWC
ncbi:YusG family protein [Neobacillus sp. PS3-34]|uniref:YusG family protein n=1 Tax=Neobacillus sp. PS3-34 TaxID=3070678 RepID=UPI0027DF0C58|nr:YusG family protein [Neobacillus sp. PS3-34]WML47047.1 YusG family protein [Neobacillus sp. PS3-34]